MLGSPVTFKSQQGLIYIGLNSSSRSASARTEGSLIRRLMALAEVINLVSGENPQH